jgi:acyl carrier protein
MAEYKPEILERVREVVAQVKEADLTALAAEDKLELDSIKRIVLIAELENAFAIEVESITPDAFESLDSLARLVSARGA